MSRASFFILFVPLFALGQSKDSLVLPNAVLYFYTQGKGEPIIILSGGPGVSAHQESDLASTLASDCKTILFEQRGTGASWTKPLDSTTINIATAINDLELLRQRLQIKQLTLCGHSWGGMLAMAYTSAFPGNVKSLILIGSGEPSYHLSPIVNASIALRRRYLDSTTFSYWSDSVNRTREPEKARYELRKFAWLSMIYDRDKIDVVMRQAEHGSFNAAMSRLMWRSLRKEKFDFTKALKAYKGKALIIFGWQDPVGSVTFHFIKEAIPHALVNGINECGHMPSQEQPEIFYRTIRAFLKEPTANNSFQK